MSAESIYEQRRKVGKKRAETRKLYRQQEHDRKQARIFQEGESRFQERNRRREAARDQRLIHTFFRWARAIRIPDLETYRWTVYGRIQGVAIDTDVRERIDVDTGGGTGDFTDSTVWLLSNCTVYKCDGDELAPHRWTRPRDMGGEDADALRSAIRSIERRYEIRFPHQDLLE